jgi:Cdc6-like AAA superfamily ATPase
MDRFIQQSDFSEHRETVIQQFRKLIEIGEKEAERLSQNNFQCLMDTPYECFKYSGNFDITKQPAISTSIANLKGFANRIFKHYDVNPSDEECNNRILQTYVQQVKPIQQLCDLKIANENGVNADFYEKIRNLLDRIKNGDVSLDPENKKIYITGTRGSGKTGFFNYFISKYEKELNQNHIITVRINVMKILANTTLLDAIRFKLCRILFTYYCSWDKGSAKQRFEKRKIKNFIDPILKNFIQNSVFGEKGIVDCHKFFNEYNVKELKSIPEEHKEICKHLLEEMSKQYKFIIILDNFDQLNPNDRSKNEYRKRIDELESIKTEIIYNHCLFLIAIRYSTYKGLTANGKYQPECWVVGSPTTYDMIKKRIDYFIQKTDITEEEKQRGEEYVVECLKFIGSSFTSENQTLDFKSACNEIDSIYSENKRIILNIMQRLIESIPDNNQIAKLESLLSRHGYKFFESLLIKASGENSDTAEGYCRFFYQYSLTDDNKLKFGNIKTSAHYDNNYIPNIYRFPSIVGKTMMFIPFLKIRILQLLKNKPNMSAKDVCICLHQIFSYREDAVGLACIELREDQSLILRDSVYEDTEDNDEAIRNIPMRLTGRGKKLLEVLPVNVNLLAVCLEQIFFPEESLSTLPIGNYYKSDFIIKNIFCSLPKVIGLLKHIEQFEKEKYSVSQEKYELYYNLGNDFSFTTQLQQSAIVSIEKIYDTHFINPAGSNNERESIFRDRRNRLDEQLLKIIPNE